MHCSSSVVNEELCEDEKRYENKTMACTDVSEIRNDENSAGPQLQNPLMEEEKSIQSQWEAFWRVVPVAKQSRNRGKILGRSRCNAGNVSAKTTKARCPRSLGNRSQKVMGTI